MQLGSKLPASRELALSDGNKKGKTLDVFTDTREGVVGMVRATVLAIIEKLHRKNSTAVGMSSTAGRFMLPRVLIDHLGDWSL